MKQKNELILMKIEVVSLGLVIVVALIGITVWSQ